MRTLLVLGSKPDPVLPPKELIDAVACANGSGASARTLGLPDPVYTVMTSLLIVGEPSGMRSLDALRGHRTEQVWFVPRPRKAMPFLKRLRNARKLRRMRSEVLERELAARDFGYNDLVVRDHDWYMETVRDVCGHDDAVCEQMAAKQPSTGVLAVALGVADDRWDRVIAAGFSFELTHAYQHNPEIDKRGTTLSRHAETDVTVLREMARASGKLLTTEPTVAERASVPLLDVASTEQESSHADR